MAVPLLLPRTKRRLAPRTRQRENARCRLSQRGTRRSRYVYVPIRMVPQVRHGTLRLRIDAPHGLASFS